MPRREGITGDWRKLRSDEFPDMCYSENIIQLFKPMKIRWTGHVALVGGRREIQTTFWWGNLMGKLS